MKCLPGEFSDLMVQFKSVTSRYLGLPGSLQQLVESPASSSLLKRLLRRGRNAVPLTLPSPPLYYRYHTLLKAWSHKVQESKSKSEILVIFSGTVFHHSPSADHNLLPTSLLPILLTR